jgi:hypothetical protein
LLILRPPLRVWAASEAEASRYEPLFDDMPAGEVDEVRLALMPENAIDHARLLRDPNKRYSNDAAVTISGLSVQIRSTPYAAAARASSTVLGDHAVTWIPFS